jgi:hypothetical protein
LKGGPLLEVGTHWVFGITEILEEIDQMESVSCEIQYPDGVDGTLCENKVAGNFVMSSGVRLQVSVDTQSPEAIREGKDIYELEVCGDGPTAVPLVLFDFVKLRDGHGRAIPGFEASSGYGRQECIDSFVKAAISNEYNDGVITCKAAAKVQNIIDSIRTGRLVTSSYI